MKTTYLHILFFTILSTSLIWSPLYAQSKRYKEPVATGEPRMPKPKKIEPEKVKPKKVAYIVPMPCENVETPVFQSSEKMKTRLAEKGINFDYLEAGFSNLGGNKVIYQYAEEEEGYLLSKTEAFTTEIAEALAQGMEKCTSPKLSEDLIEIVLLTETVESKEELEQLQGASYSGELGGKVNTSYKLDGTTKSKVIKKGAITVEDQILLKLVYLSERLQYLLAEKGFMLNEKQISFKIKTASSIDYQYLTTLSFGVILQKEK